MGYSRAAATAFCLASTLFASGRAAAQTSQSELLSTQLISARKLQETGVPLDGTWKYRIGDNPSWSLPTYNDSDWKTLSPAHPTKELLAQARALEAQGKPAIIWLRLKVNPERALIRKPLSLDFNNYGATELFVDARKILALGEFDKPGSKARIATPLLPTPILFDSSSAVLAIRYHLGSALDVRPQMTNLFEATLRSDAAIARSAEQRRFMGGLLLGLFGLLVGVGVLHFVLYILLRKPVSNLHYAAFAGQFSIYPLTIYLAYGTQSVRAGILLNQIGTVLAGLALLALLTFLYATFYQRIPRIAAVPVALTIFWMISVLLPQSPVTDLAIWIALLGFTVEGTRVIISAFLHKKEGAKTIGVGFLFTFGVLAYLAFARFGLYPLPEFWRQLFLFSWLGVAFAPSLHLAHGFASTSKGFEKLSSELTDSNRSLEGKVAERTAALEQQMQIERHRAREQTALLDTMSELSGQLELSKLLQSVLERAVNLIGTSGGELAIVDDAAQELVIVANKHMSANTVGLRQRIDEGAMGTVMRSHEQLVIPDYTNWEGRSAQYGAVISHAVVVSPLLIGSAPVGAIAVWHEDPDKQFTPADLRLLNAFAQQAAVAIGNARLYTEAQEQRQYFESVVVNSPVAIVTLDLNSNIASANPAFEKLFGWRDEEIVGQNLDALVTDETTRQEANNYTSAAMNDNIHGFGRRRRKDGQWVEVEILAVPVFNGDQRRGLVCLYHDVTELTRAKREAEAADRAKSQFLANMSHELRTPLNAVIGYSEMLMEEATDAGDEGYVPDLQKIHSSGRHLLGLINDILDLSKIEAGRMEMYLETFDVAAMIEEVATTITPLIEKNGNSLVMQIGEDLGLARLDQVKVRQILFNLLSNASKFTENGKVTLAALRENNRICFRVSDTGIGMTDDQMAKLFQPFTQADASTTKKYGGTGLGLVITRRFCEMMGGTIDLHSEADHGTTFTVSLPTDAETYAEASDATVEFDGALPLSGTVLIIDDDAVAREMLTRMLSKEGYRVLVAASGEEGLRIAHDERPDAITLDVLMAGMDGWGVLTRLKADTLTADIPVVVVTVIDDRNMGFALGAADYLTKPIERERLADALRRVRADNASGPALVVDDDATTREMLRRILEKDGWRVVEAVNGREAIDRLLQDTPSVVLLDLMMPEMDGFTFIEEIRKRNVVSLAPIVVLTAKTLTDADRQRLHGAVARVLQKGEHSMQEVVSEIRRVMQTRRVTQNA
jgi:PAS domain S-box-containing protein